jgi:hypothetical protein
MNSFCTINWEAWGIWVEAIALIFIFGLDFKEHREQRQARKEDREERRQAAIARQRGEVTCAGIIQLLRILTEEQRCEVLWAGQFRHAGFAFESGLYAQLPEYLRKKSEQFVATPEAIATAKARSSEQHKIDRFLLGFRFPYPDYELVLEDVRRLNFGTACLAWDDSGRPIKISQD